MNASKIAHESLTPKNLAMASSELKKLEQPDAVLQHLENSHLPLTRENYLETAYPLGLPDNWGPEHEALLPTELRRIII